MPSQSIWVDPDVFMTHNGVSVYHTYVDDDVEQGECRYTFTTDSAADDNRFDVRQLNVPSQSRLSIAPAPFLSKSNPEFVAASEEQKAQWDQQWDAWFDFGEREVIKTIVTEAIDMGLITNQGGN